MSEGIVLPKVARGVVLDEAERLARLDEAAPRILAAVADEDDEIAVEATLASLLFETFAQASWVGFYRRTGARLLTVGPYQGPMGCTRIDFARGVCGAAARTRSTQLVPDVREFPGHIACDDATLSELVVPILEGEEARAVLDLDSHALAAFSRGEAERVERLLASAFAAVKWPKLVP